MSTGCELIECDRSRGAEILAILNDAILHTTALYDYRPRPLSSMDAWFDVKAAAGYPVIGAVASGRLLGFATYGEFRARPAYKYTVEDSVYVERESQGLGIGRLLLEALIERARTQGYHTLVGGIDAGNTASIALHRRCGFSYCGEIRQAGFKFGRWLDLQFFQRILDTPADPVDG